MSAYRNRNFPHPTLTPGNNQDYQQDIRFQTDIKAVRQDRNNQTLVIMLQHETTGTVLPELLAKKQAAYWTITECIPTGLREIHRQETMADTIQLNAGRYQGTVTIRPFIIADTDLTIKNDDWNDHLQQMLPDGIGVPQGAILAIAEEATFNTESTGELESCLEIAITEAVNPGQYRIELNGERIVIQFNPEQREGLEKARRDEKLSTALHPSVYHMAIHEAVRQHRNQEHNGRKWANIIAEKLAEAELATDDPEILDAKALEYSQQIMENPLQKLMPTEDGTENPDTAGAHL